MGTRSSTVIKDKELGEIVVMYRQYDGYPSGHGLELAEFLRDIKLTNGISFNAENTANGIGCLAAQIVDHFKVRVGGIYLYPANFRDCWYDYVYVVGCKLGQNPYITIYEYDNIIYEGLSYQVLEWCRTND